MVELGFHLGCEKSKGRKMMTIADGLKDCSSTAGVAGEPRILVSSVDSSDGDEDGFFFLLHGLPLSPDLRHHHNKCPCNTGEQGNGVTMAGATARQRR